MRALDIIIKKRSGDELNREEIRFLMDGYVAGDIPEYQISAFLMAVFFQGLNSTETSLLTQAMIDSGDVIKLDSLQGYAGNYLVDKHSTGGVGDKVSLILAPIVAAAGAQVPMMSGRGLGHTGGTLDKLETIPGYSTALSPAEFVKIIDACGFAMTGQSARIVPADKKLYALRDVTGTVESVPLITASILSKKFAEGTQHLVFDVKCGKGAFMKTPEQAEKLARSLVRTGKELGRGVIALISRMDSPLGVKVGNFFEVEESIACLRCEGWEADFENGALNLRGGSADLMEVTLHLAAHMLVLSSVAKDFNEGMERSLDVLRKGTALEHFWQNVALQGGRRQDCLDLIGRRDGLLTRDISAGADGFLKGLDAYKIGVASVLLGAGRNVASDKVLPDVGIELHASPGTRLVRGEKVLTLFARDEARLEAAADCLEGIVELSETTATATETDAGIHGKMIYSII